MLQGFREKLKKISIFRIFVMFFARIYPGYRIYADLLKKVGNGGVLLGTAWRGTGDYYICGLYLSAWLQKNGISNYLFLCPEGAEEKVLSLFPILRQHCQTLPKGPDYYYLLLFRAFLGPQICRFIYFHHQQPFPSNDALNTTNGWLQGFRGLNMLDFYLACGFHLEDDAPKSAPEFLQDRGKIKKWFQDYGLKEGKTVLLAPYSTGLEKFLPPETYWEEITHRLQKEGYTVCTNCFGEEKPIEGTVRISIPFSEIVPFLDMAGSFWGIRSGLCDIISTSTCEKVVIHLYKAKWWPDGRSIPYTGIKSLFPGNVTEIEI